MFIGILILFAAEVAFSVAVLAPDLANRYRPISEAQEELGIPGYCQECHDYAVLFEQDKSVQSFVFTAMAFLATTIMFAFIMLSSPQLRFCLGNFSAGTTLISVTFAAGALTTWAGKVREYLYRSSQGVQVLATGLVGYAYVVFIFGGLLDAVGGLCVFAAAHWDVPCPCSKVPKEYV